MRHMTGRVRIAVSTAAALATLALPLVIVGNCLADGDGVVRAGQSVSGNGTEPGEPGELVTPKPKDPFDEKGSWVWDKEKP